MKRNLFNKQLTIRDLINIDKSRINQSKNLKVQLISIYDNMKEENWFNKSIGFFKNKLKLIYYKVFKYKVKSDSGKIYTCFIKVSPSFSVHKFYTNKVKVFCQCPDFMYRAAYDLFKNENVYINKETTKHLGDALEIPPTVVTTTNICKHLYATIIHFKNNIRMHHLIKSK